MSNRTRFTATVTFTARKAGAINRFIEYMEGGQEPLVKGDHELAIGVLRQIMANAQHHETQQAPPPPLLRPNLSPPVPGQD